MFPDSQKEICEKPIRFAVNDQKSLYLIPLKGVTTKGKLTVSILGCVLSHLSLAPTLGIDAFARVLASQEAFGKHSPWHNACRMIRRMQPALVEKNCGEKNRTGLTEPHSR
jgi:hypothetical protein